MEEIGDIIHKILPLVLLFLFGCVTAPPDLPINDRLATNRPVFSANDGFDEMVMGPVARGWIKITPAVVRNSISRSYHNLTFPDRFVSLTLQWEPIKAGSELGRFAVNSTVGIAGLADVASTFGMPKYDEDMGKTFAKWGIPPGDYLVVPFVGVFSSRDLAGGIIDLMLNPLTWAPGLPGFGAGAIFAINGRAQMELEIQHAKDAALDYYTFTRDAYIQKRISLTDEE